MPTDISREMEAFRSALQERGLALTRQRLALARIIFSTHSHFSADELYDWAREKGLKVGRVTAYRTLKVLLEAGLVEDRQFGEDRVRYEHVFGHRHHDHMVCLACDKVIEFESSLIEAEQARIAKAHRFQVVRHRHTLLGFCRNCKTRGGNPKSQIPNPNKNKEGGGSSRKS